MSRVFPTYSAIILQILDTIYIIAERQSLDSILSQQALQEEAVH